MATERVLGDNNFVTQRVQRGLVRVLGGKCNIPVGYYLK